MSKSSQLRSALAGLLVGRRGRERILERGFLALHFAARLVAAERARAYVFSNSILNVFKRKNSSIFQMGPVAHPLGRVTLWFRLDKSILNIPTHTNIHTDSGLNTPKPIPPLFSATSGYY